MDPDRNEVRFVGWGIDAEARGWKRLGTAMLLAGLGVFAFHILAAVVLGLWALTRYAAVLPLLAVSLVLVYAGLKLGGGLEVDYRSKVPPA